MSQIIFITGGARSGKSRFAEEWAIKAKQEVTYLATAQAFDEEMTERIKRHQQQRPQWITQEQPIHLTCIKECTTPVLLLDCLSLWVSNLMLADWSDEAILSACQELLQDARERKGVTLLVSNEVGSGIVPDNILARRYRDVLGWVNQQCAAQSDQAYLCVSGLSIALK